MWLWELLIKYFGVMAFAGLGGITGSLIIEKWKSHLGKKNREHDVVFTKYHEKQLEILPQLFKIISKLERDLDIYLYLMRGYTNELDDNKLFVDFEKEVISNAMEFSNYYYDNEIFFEKKFRNKIKVIIETIDETFGRVWKVHKNFMSIQSASNNNQLPETWEKVISLNEKYKEEFPKLKDELREEIHSVLKNTTSDKV